MTKRQKLIMSAIVREIAAELEKNVAQVNTNAIGGKSELIAAMCKADYAYTHYEDKV